MQMIGICQFYECFTVIFGASLFIIDDGKAFNFLSTNISTTWS